MNDGPLHLPVPDLGAGPSPRVFDSSLGADSSVSSLCSIIPLFGSSICSKFAPWLSVFSPPSSSCFSSWSVASFVVLREIKEPVLLSLHFLCTSLREISSKTK